MNVGREGKMKALGREDRRRERKIEREIERKTGERETDNHSLTDGNGWTNR